MSISAQGMFFLLMILFVVILFIVCGKKGFRSLVSLGITIATLSVVVIPLIIQNYDPVTIILIASVPITFLVIYSTEGFNVLSHLSIFLTLVNFLVLSILIELAITLPHFTGIVSDEASTIGGQLGINLPKLLIASIMLSTLGALIEMIVTQVGTVIELIEANPHNHRNQIYKQAYNIGVIHLGSIINTLFLIYAGVLLPTLIVFSGSQNYLYSTLNYEPVSSEIMRMILGTIGVIVAMPTSTFFAVQWLKSRSLDKDIA